MTDSEYRSLAEQSPAEAQRRLFDEYANYAYAIVFGRLRSCSSREDIDECVADVFADIFRRLDSTSGFDGDLKGIIAAVARNKAIDRYNAAASADTAISLEEEKISKLSSDENIQLISEQRELQTLALELIDSLGEPDRTIILQRYYCERSSRQVAAMVGLTPAAVRVRCGRALKKLKKLFSEAGITP